MLHSSSLKGATFTCFVTTLCCTASSNHQTIKPINHKTCHGSSSLLCQHVQEPQGSTEENHPNLGSKCPTKLQHWKISLRQGAPKKYLAYHQHSWWKTSKNKAFFFSKTTHLHLLQCHQCHLMERLNTIGICLSILNQIPDKCNWEHVLSHSLCRLPEFSFPPPSASKATSAFIALPLKDLQWAIFGKITKGFLAANQMQPRCTSPSCSSILKQKWLLSPQKKQPLSRCESL